VGTTTIFDVLGALSTPLVRSIGAEDFLLVVTTGTGMPSPNNLLDLQIVVKFADLSPKVFFLTQVAVDGSVACGACGG
jgi:hypothetical protein